MLRQAYPPPPRCGRAGDEVCAACHWPRGVWQVHVLRHHTAALPRVQARNPCRESRCGLLNPLAAALAPGTSSFAPLHTSTQPGIQAPAMQTQRLKTSSIRPVAMSEIWSHSRMSWRSVSSDPMGAPCRTLLQSVRQPLLCPSCHHIIAHCQSSKNFADAFVMHTCVPWLQGLAVLHGVP